tara:strand:- start:3182 stop:5023 length:1842 start_codon:yes stop_codon:yes gene_type:complete
MKSLFRLFLRATLLPPVQLLYRVRRIGTGFVPREGGVLLIGNHVSYIDCFIVFLACPRPVRFVVLESYTKTKGVGWFLNLFGGIPIRPNYAREAIQRTVDALKEGTVVCVFPEGGLTRHGALGEFKKGFEIIARKSECAVVPFYMDGLWNSIFSYERGCYFKKRPNGWTCPIQVAFGRPIRHTEATAERVKQAVMEQSIEAFCGRRDFEVPLEKAVIRSLKRKRRDSLFVEYGKNGPRDMSRANTLGMATSMARRWMNQPPEPGDRVGIMLPPGPMASVINLGLFLAGKTPVNLPFSLDQKELEATARSVAPLGIRTVITSRAFMPHLIDFWQGDEGVFIDMQSVTSTPGSPMALFERIRAVLEPAWLTCWRLDLNNRPLDREAVGMVPTPGEDPVLLNAMELHRNAIQVRAADFLRPTAAVFIEESLSRPEGLTLGCWTAVLSQGKVTCRSFALRDDYAVLERSILEQEVTLVVGSRPFFAGVEQSLSIRSIQYGVLFGPANLWEIEEWEERLDFPIARAWSCQGRIVSMSRTDPNDKATAHHKAQQGRLPKSVGRVLPGMAVEIEDYQLKFRFDPVGSEDSRGVWLAGPRNAEMNPEGFLFFPEAELLDSE